MTVLRVPTILITLLLLVAASLSAQTQNSSIPDYDVVRDFSLASNPNGVWSYGWQASKAGPLTLYTWSDNTCFPGMSWWGWYRAMCDALPVVGHNDTGKMFCDKTYCLPPNYLLLHPGDNYKMSVVRWTAPVAGTFLMEGAVNGLDTGGTSLHIVLNSNQYLFDTHVSYKTPLLLQHTFAVAAGDTIDFVVDRGKDGGADGDSTGIQFKLTNTGTR